MQSENIGLMLSRSLQMWQDTYIAFNYEFIWRFIFAGILNEAYIKQQTDQTLKFNN